MAAGATATTGFSDKNVTNWAYRNRDDGVFGRQNKENEEAVIAESAAVKNNCTNWNYAERWRAVISKHGGTTL